MYFTGLGKLVLFKGFRSFGVCVFSGFVKTNILDWCSRDDGDVLDDSAFRIRAGAPSGRRGLQPSPRPTARKPSPVNSPSALTEESKNTLRFEAFWLLL
jgi:hypothetical protein